MKVNNDVMKRYVYAKAMKAFYKSIHSGVLNTVLDLAALFYFLVCLNMYFQGNAVWREKPHNVVFFAPMMVVCVVAVCVMFYHFQREWRMLQNGDEGGDTSSCK